MNVLEWKCLQDLVVAYDGRYNLCVPSPKIDCFAPFGDAYVPITKFQWYDNILATVGEDSVCLWVVIKSPNKSSNIMVSKAGTFLLQNEMPWQLVESSAIGSGMPNRVVSKKPFQPRIL